MAVSYKDIIITPNRGSSTNDPQIAFQGGNTSVNTTITLKVYPESNGTLSFEGSAGQLFSITNDLTGSIFSVNDVSGIPSIDVNANGTIALAPYGGNVGIGRATAGYKLDVVGTVNASSVLVNGGTTLHIGNYNTYAVKRTGNPGNINLNSSTYYTGSQVVGFDVGTNIPGGNYGTMLNMQERGDTAGQLVIDYSTGYLFTRGIQTTTPTFSPWRTYLNDANYNSYAPTLTGGGASGTWSINVTGSAGSATTATTATNWGTYGAVPAAGTTFANASTIGRSDTNGYTYFGYINSSTSNSENPTVSQVIVTNGSDNFYRKASIAHFTSAVQTNASGTWSINVTGSAGSASTATTATNQSGGTVSATTGSFTGRVTAYGALSSGTLLNATGSLGAIEIYGGGGANASFMTFHRPGVYASYFGIDTDNNFAVGGWSAGAALGLMKVGSFGVGTAASGTAGEIRATNNITAYYSDKRLKEIQGTIPNALKKVNSLSGIIYKDNYIANQYGYNSQDEQVGVIAQEVEAVLPQIVKAAPFDIAKDDEGNEYSKSGENYKTVQYDKLVPLLIEAIKELSDKVERLEKGKK
jgi:hypothetical protein